MRYILDVSNIIYGGHYASSTFYVDGFPAGGLRRIMGLLNAYHDSGDVFLCLDGGAKLKKELLPEYKSGRVPNYSVLAQLETFEEILNECNIPYYKEFGYEADDFICSLVHQSLVVGSNAETVIISDDQDLSCCVNAKTSLKGATINGSIVTMKNYNRRAVRKSGTVMNLPYNTSLLYKIIHGDPSDSYKALHLPGVSFDKLALDYLDLLKPLIANGSLSEAAYINYNIFCAVVDSLPDTYSKDVRDKLKERGRIVFPYIKDVLDTNPNEFVTEISQGIHNEYSAWQAHSKVVNYRKIDSKRFNAYCTVLNLNRCRSDRMSDPFSDLHTEIKSKFKEKAKALSDGSLAAERYVSRAHKVAEPLALPDIPLPQ